MATDVIIAVDQDTASRMVVACNRTADRLLEVGESAEAVEVAELFYAAGTVVRSAMVAALLRKELDQ